MDSLERAMYVHAKNCQLHRQRKEGRGREREREKKLGKKIWQKLKSFVLFLAAAAPAAVVVVAARAEAVLLTAKNTLTLGEA